MPIAALKDLFQDWGSCVQPVEGQATGVATFQCIPVVFHNVVTAALILSGVVALFFIIFSGIRLITSGGEAKAVEGARKTLTFAIIGLLVVLLSFFIINVIAGVTGTNCITQLSFNGCN